MTIRSLRPKDLPAVAAIQAASPEAASWPVVDYLRYVALVAEDAGELLGFAVGRQIVAEEAEILNLAVAREHRRRGVGRGLVKELQNRLCGEIFLEVRASNERAIALYESLGFRRAGTRAAYYAGPGEDGIVLRFQAC